MSQLLTGQAGQKDAGTGTGYVPRVRMSPPESQTPIGKRPWGKLTPEQRQRIANSDHRGNLELARRVHEFRRNNHTPTRGGLI